MKSFVVFTGNNDNRHSGNMIYMCHGLMVGNLCQNLMFIIKKLIANY